MIDHPNKQTPTSSRRIRTLGLVALGVIAGVGGTLLLRPGAKHEHVATGATAPKTQMYQCPMHPQIIMDHPGTCPICGMTLVPMESNAPKEKGKLAFYRSPMNPSLTSQVPIDRK